MKSLFFLVSFGLVMVWNIGCQSAYRVNSESLPKKLQFGFTLLDAQEKTINFEDIYQKHAATVIIFWQTGCPCVKRYQNRVNKLFNTYSPLGVAFYHVSSNNNEPFDKVKEVYKNRNIPLPLLRDNEGVLAKAVGAKGTPTAAIINQAGEMIFIGWIDNERDEQETGRKAYLENALNNFINSKAISQPTSPMFGCAIR